MKEQSITVFTSFFMLSWWFYECWVYKLFVDRVIERQSNIRTFLWRVFECTSQQVDKQLVNLSTRKFVTQKNFVHLLLCLLSQATRSLVYLFTRPLSHFFPILFSYLLIFYLSLHCLLKNNILLIKNQRIIFKSSLMKKNYNSLS